MTSEVFKPLTYHFGDIIVVSAVQVIIYRSVNYDTKEGVSSHCHAI